MPLRIVSGIIASTQFMWTCLLLGSSIMLSNFIAYYSGISSSASVFSLFSYISFEPRQKILCGPFPFQSLIVLSRTGPIPWEDISLAAQFSSTRADKPFPACLLLYCTTRISLRTGSFCGLENRTNSQIFNLVLLSTKLKFWHSVFSHTNCSV